MDWLKALAIPYKITILTLPMIFSAIVGYLFATAKSFKEEKMKAYNELLPSIVRMVYDRASFNEAEFSKCLMKLSLYGSKKAAEKMEVAIRIFHHTNDDNITEALQKAIVEMRKDIQIWPWQWMKPEAVNHLYTKMTRES